MRAEDADQSGDVGQLDSDVMIETPSPRERGIEASRIVTRCADEHALDLLETLNGLEQRGHDRGPPRVVFSALTTRRENVTFVDVDDAWAMLNCLGKRGADSGSDVAEVPRLV